MAWYGYCWYNYIMVWGSDGIDGHVGGKSPTKERGMVGKGGNGR